MTTFEIVIVCGAFCGVLMVIGGMVLLAIGAIKLEAAGSAAGKRGKAQPDAMALEFKKTIKVTTAYPALALFLIGVLFIVTAAWFSKPDKVLPWSLEGKVDSPDPSEVMVEVTVDTLGTLKPNYDGTIEAVIYPHLDVFKAVITAPGYKPQNLSLKKDAKKHVLQLVAERLQKLVNKPDGTQIAQVPSDVQLAPVTESGKFGK
jgi:hypothetical protein